VSLILAPSKRYLVALDMRVVWYRYHGVRVSNSRYLIRVGLNPL